jgi:hypothetical protein
MAFSSILAMRYQHTNVRLVFFVLTYGSTSLFASIRASVFSFREFMLSPSKLMYPHRPEADVSHSTSVYLGFLGPS